jgi:chromosome segregation ATPase
MGWPSCQEDIDDRISDNLRGLRPDPPSPRQSVDGSSRPRVSPREAADQGAKLIRRISKLEKENSRQRVKISNLSKKNRQLTGKVRQLEDQMRILRIEKERFREENTRWRIIFNRKD